MSEAKDGASTKIWKAVGIMISIMIALVVAFAIMGALMPEIFSGLLGTISSFGNGVKQIGPMATNLNIDIGISMGAIFALIIKIMFYILAIAFAAYFVKIMLDKMRGK